MIAIYIINIILGYIFWLRKLKWRNGKYVINTYLLAFLLSASIIPNVMCIGAYLLDLKNKIKTWK